MTFLPTFLPPTELPPGGLPPAQSRYLVYRVSGQTETFLGQAPAGATTLAGVAHAAGTEATYRVYAVSAAGVRSTAYADVYVARAADGTVTIGRPNAPALVTARPAAGGSVVVEVGYDPTGETATGAVLEVARAPRRYGGYDFDVPEASVTLTSTRPRSYTMTLGPYADGTTVRLAVRVRSAGGAVSPTVEVLTYADATAPAAQSSLAAEQL